MDETYSYRDHLSNVILAKFAFLRGEECGSYCGIDESGRME